MRNVAGRLVPLVAVVAGACDAGSGAQSAGVAVRDSAGIRIVQSSGPAWQEEAGWQIELSPFVVIGVVDGDAMQQLFRVSAATRLADGTIVIADAGSPHVRWYAASGEFLKGTGRSGEVQGEFSDFGAGGMCRPGEDFLLVSDPMQARANVFTVGCEFSALVRAPAVAAGFPSIQGCFAGGTLQLWHAEQPAERIPDTMMENVFVFTRIDADGTILNELARHRTRTQYLLSTESGGGTYHSIPFTVRPSGSTFGERFFFTAGADPEIEVRRPDGTLEALWQWTRPRTRSRDVVSRYERHTIDAQQRPEQRTQGS
jgi:hypothetical protein